MVETEEKLETIEVVKRNGKKVEFDGTKVAMAIKKGFDSVLLDSEENEKKYNTKDYRYIFWWYKFSFCRAKRYIIRGYKNRCPQNYNCT